MPRIYIGNLTQTERRELLVYGAAFIIVAMCLASMWYLTWVNGAWRLLATFTAATSIPGGSSGLEAIILFSMGIYFGLLGLFVNDHRKRLQGYLLIIGSVVFFAGLALAGLGFIPGLVSLLSLLLGLIVGISVELISIDRTSPEFRLKTENIRINFENSRFGRAVNNRGETMEFEAAALGLKVYIFSFIIVGNILNISLAMPTPTLIQTGFPVVSIILLIFLNKFIDVNATVPVSEKRFEVIGQKQSGKTYLILGLFLTAQRENAYEFREWNDAVDRIKTEYSNMVRADAPLTWGSEDEQDARLNATQLNNLISYEFQIECGEVTPRQYSLSMTDHAGEILPGIADKISKKPVTDGGQGGESKPSDEADADRDDTEEDQTAFDYLGDEDESEPFDEADAYRNDIEVASDPSGEETGNFQQPPNEGTEEEEDERGDEDESEPFDEADAYRNDIEVASDPSGEETGNFQQPPNEGIEEEEDERGDEDESEPFDEADAYRNDIEVASDPSGEETGNFQQPPNEGIEEEEDERGDEDESESTQVTESREEAVDKVVTNIRSSDFLLMLIDAHRLKGGKPMGKESYQMLTYSMKQIVNHTDVREIIPIVTKADYFIEDFKQNLDDSNKDTGQDEAPTPTDGDHWNEFRKYVTKQVEQSRVSPFFNVVNANNVYPVYYHTEEREDASGRLPEANEDGEIQPEGYTTVLSYITSTGE